MNRWNEIPYDVLEALCKETATLPSSSPSTNDSRKSLFALSLVDSRTREACYPWLFHKVTFNKRWSEGPSWEAFDERMKHIIKNPALYRAVKSFELNVWVSDIKRDYLPPTTYGLLPTFLASPPQLHTLAFRSQPPFVPSFCSAFNDVAKVQGPLLTIEKLIISPSCAFLIDHCPNILEFEDSSLLRDKLVEFTTLTKPLSTSCHRLRAFSTTVVIGSSTLQDILKAIPLLEELKLSRSLSPRRRMWRYRSERRGNGQGIMKLLPDFACFPHLHKLVLPDASSLDIGFNPPWISHADTSNPGLVERIARQGQEASERVAKGVQEVCPSVNELWVGHICFKRDEKGVMVYSDPDNLINC
ncbi:hypothetical protein JAAARDRAFT_208432 [Jaapia argillacea MUCL 33604]|uniref:F-box domain-containing protein n=1 Tax=Jaapia argillacea MUCL 33604 TaxID=933084 RepID=A0A067PL58_9AGAM|nr:hypothetical protein JAAARDRAFT_208432 [Jaapia argillacea MUCL 33604]